MGQLELIGKVSAFVSWANLSNHPTCTTCPYDSLVQKPIVCLGGPTQPTFPNFMMYDRARASVCAIAFKLLWVNSSSLVRSPHSHRILLDANYANPCGSMMRQPIACLIGQPELIVQISQWMKWAHESACRRLL